MFNKKRPLQQSARDEEFSVVPPLLTATAAHFRRYSFVCDEPAKGRHAFFHRI